MLFFITQLHSIRFDSIRFAQTVQKWFVIVAITTYEEGNKINGRHSQYYHWID